MKKKLTKKQIAAGKRLEAKLAQNLTLEVRLRYQDIGSKKVQFKDSLELLMRELKKDYGED